MPSEIEPTLTTIESLFNNNVENTTISILQNGGTSLQLKEKFSKIKNLKYYESKDNLGVAGGRNFLLKTDECNASDVILFLDNDVITPVDYVERLTTFLIHQKDAGVVGAMTADINYSTYGIIKSFNEKGVWGGLTSHITSNEIKKELIGMNFSMRMFHMGTRHNYYYTYFSFKLIYFELFNRLLCFLRYPLDVHPELKKNLYYEKLVAEGIDKYDVSNVPGCCQAFKKSLIDEIGYLDECFNPYGYEDVDFCIRAVKNGYTNYIDTNTWLLHGTDSRHGKRDVYIQEQNRFKCMTILSYNAFKSIRKCKVIIVKLIILNFINKLMPFSNVNSIRWIKSAMNGFKIGLKIIKEKKHND
ncbi:glycosyltransferase family 2 protein [Desulfobacula toluolica]|nr:glycosyltransferase [Desulfobacula toluolica]